MKSRWITYKGKRIFIADYSEFGSNIDGVQEEINNVLETVTCEPLESVLAVSDVHGTYADGRLFKIMGEAFPKFNPYVKRRAMVGLPDLRKHLLTIFNTLTGVKHFRAFDEMEDALDWLTAA